MVPLAANLTLIIKYVRLQRETNKTLRGENRFWIGNFFTALFFFCVLICSILMFARTVALQVGKLALLNPDNYVSAAALYYFTPNYKNKEEIFDRKCMTTFIDPDTQSWINFPTLVYPLW